MNRKKKNMSPRARLFLWCINILSVLAVVPSIGQSITSFTPISGPTGSEGTTKVTITGTGFNTTPSNNIVFFGAVGAVPSAATATSLTVTVPAGATYQNLTVVNKVTNLRATCYSQEPFIPTFYNEGAMQFSGTSDYVFAYASSKPYFKTGDIDGDGKPDVVLLNVAANTVSILRNTSTPGALSFDTKVDIATGTTPSSFVIEDIDGDGKLDLVVGNVADQSFSVILNTSTAGAVSFAAKADFTLAGPTAAEEITVHDFNLDGKPDVAYQHYVSTAGTIHVFANTGSVGSPAFTTAYNLTTLAPRNFFCADFDRDGKVDLASVSSAGTGNSSIYRNSTNTPGTLSLVTTPYQIQVGTAPAWAAAGDLDNDGKPDIVSTNVTGNNIATLLNTSSVGSLSFATRVGTTLGTTNPTCVVITDIDGDGKPDIAASAKGNGSVNIFRNNSTVGAITLGARVSLFPLTSPDFLGFCDFDGDGKPDMAVVNSSSFIIQKSISKPKAALFMGRFAF